MITQVTEKIKIYWEQWIKKRNIAGNPQTFTSRNLYILPSKFGLAYGGVIIILFVIAINYQVNTIFLMAFLLMTIGLLSAWEAHANLKNLSIRLMTIEDTQEGIPAKIVLSLQENNHQHTKNRFGIALQIASQPHIRLEKIPPEGQSIIIPINTNRRGYFPLPSIKISSLYPFGIFQVWSYAYFEEFYYVYPKPIDPGFWPEPSQDQACKKKYAIGDEEFYDLKQVENPWTEPNLIAWKIAAKGQGWYLKRMANDEVDYWLFKLNDLPPTDIELKLQYLSFWLQSAESHHLIYGLKLNLSSPVHYAYGKEHLKHCLRQLAAYR